MELDIRHASHQNICQLSIGPFAYSGGWMELYLGCHDSGRGLIILSTGKADPRPQHDKPSSSRVLAKAGHRSSKTDGDPSWIFNGTIFWPAPWSAVKECFSFFGPLLLYAPNNLCPDRLCWLLKVLHLQFQMLWLVKCETLCPIQTAHVNDPLPYQSEYHKLLSLEWFSTIKV